MKKGPIAVSILLAALGTAAGKTPENLIIDSHGAGELSETDAANRPVLSGSEQILNSPGGHFKIHWTDSGSDSVSYAYALSIAIAADSSWQVQCNEMGFFQPPPDNGIGGDDLYDIYIVSLSGEVTGYTSCFGEYHPPDSTHDCSASYIVVHSSIPDADQRNCVVAHEFQHAIQISYDYNEAGWFMENCAVWMTEMVYPDADDYLGIISSGDNALRTPWLDIRSYSHGGFPWAWMMWDRWGYESVRSVWEYCASEGGNNMFGAHESMFTDHGITFEEFFMDYGAWRWFTADNWFDGCGMYNPEASTWLPGPVVLPCHDVTSLPFTGDQTADSPPERYGIHWIRVDLSNYQDNWIMMNFNGRDYFEWNMGVIMQNLSGQLYFEWFDCDPSTGDLELVLEANGWDYFIYFPAFMDITSLDHLYEISILLNNGIEGSSVVEDQLNLRVSSNPMPARGSVTFSLPESGSVLLQIYDLSGRKAATIVHGEMDAGIHTVPLDVPDLSPGTYFVVLFSGDSMAGERVVILRNEP